MSETCEVRDCHQRAMAWVEFKGRNGAPQRRHVCPTCAQKVEKLQEHRDDRTCMVDGCSNKMEARGLCKSHYLEALGNNTIDTVGLIRVQGKSATPFRDAKKVDAERKAAKAARAERAADLQAEKPASQDDELAVAKADIVRLSRKVNELHDDLEKERNDARREADGLRKELAESQQKIEHFGCQIDIADQVATERDQQIAELERENAHAAEELDVYQQQLAAIAGAQRLFSTRGELMDAISNACRQLGIARLHVEVIGNEIDFRCAAASASMAEA